VLLGFVCLDVQAPKHPDTDIDVLAKSWSVGGVGFSLSGSSSSFEDIYIGNNTTCISDMQLSLQSATARGLLSTGRRSRSSCHELQAWQNRIG